MDKIIPRKSIRERARNICNRFPTCYGNIRLEQAIATLGQQIEDESLERHKNELIELKTPLPCGHLPCRVKSSDEGTTYCALCEANHEIERLRHALRDSEFRNKNLESKSWELERVRAECLKLKESSQTLPY